MASGWLGADWGNVPSWVGTTFTSASLTLAAVTYWRNSKERAREHDDRERSQAAKVTWWPENRRLLMVRNGNDVAILVRGVLTGDRPGVSDRVAFAPAETRGLTLPAVYDSVPEVPALSLFIVDSHGRSWRRGGPDGDLVRTAGEELPEGAVRLDWKGRS